MESIESTSIASSSNLSFLIFQITKLSFKKIPAETDGNKNCT